MLLYIEKTVQNPVLLSNLCTKYSLPCPTKQTTDLQNKQLSHKTNIQFLVCVVNISLSYIIPAICGITIYYHCNHYNITYCNICSTLKMLLHFNYYVSLSFLFVITIHCMDILFNAHFLHMVNWSPFYM